MEQEKQNKKNNPKGANKEFPLTSLGVAEEVLLAIDKAGGKIDTQALSTALNLKGGAFARKLSSIKRYNLVSGQGTLYVTELGKKILHPISDEELSKIRKEVFLSVPLFQELYNRFNDELPEQKTFKAILVREHDIKDVDANTIFNIYKNSIKEFLSAAGEDIVAEQPTKGGANNKITYTNKKPEIKQNGLVSIYISSPMGENNLKADNKTELKNMKNKIEKLFALIEDELPENNHTGSTAEEPKPNLSSEETSDSSEVAN
ncbi:MAG: hypothetical protein ABH873_03200 [Candidatus Firestonebacteria bacterium]